MTKKRTKKSIYIESNLIDALNEHLQKKYGSKTFAYHTHSSGYGESGFPDLVIFHNGKMILAECKRDCSSDDAIRHLRPSQIGMIEKICWSGIPVYLLYKEGICKKEFNVSWEVFHDTIPFSCIDDVLETLI